jgi:hypothetical protein
MGISGNANILGDVFINGSLQVSGGAFETQTLISSAPLFTTGTGATNDVDDRGFLAEYKGDSASAIFEIGTVSASAGLGTVTRKGYTVLTKAITDNVGTLVIQEPSHTILQGEEVVIANLGSPWDGTKTVTAVTGTTLSFAATGANLAPTADTDGTIAVNIPEEFQNGDSIIIADCSVASLNGQRNFVQTVSGNELTFDFNGSQALTSASGTVSVNTKTMYAGLVRSTANDEWYLVGSYPAVASAGIYAAPSTELDVDLAGITYPILNVGGIKFIDDTNQDLPSSISGNIDFPGNITLSGSANVLSGTFTGNPTISGNPTFSGAPVFSGQPVFTGGIRIQEMVEDVVGVSQSSNTVSMDYTAGNIFFLTNTPEANMTLNITNAPTTDDRVFTINFIVTQGATGYIPSTLNINGSSSTLRWTSGVVPLGTSSSGKIDIFSFTIIRRSGAFITIANASLNY